MAFLEIMPELRFNWEVSQNQRDRRQERQRACKAVSRQGEKHTTESSLSNTETVRWASPAVQQFHRRGGQ